MSPHSEPNLADPTPADSDERSLDLVRRRIMAITFVGITMHALIAMVVTAHWMADHGRASDAAIMLGMSVPTAALIYGATRLILRKPLVSLGALPWIALAVSPTVAGIIWIAN